MGYNVQLISEFLLCDILIATANHLGLLEGAITGGCHVCYPGKVPDENGKTSRTKQKMPCTCFISAVNRNQLLFFLLSNVLTGMVNFSIKTIFCTPQKGFVIVGIYLMALNFLISVLHLRGKTLKL